VPLLERERVAEAHVGPDDDEARPPREEGLLQLDRAPGCGLGLREVAQQRRAVRELQRAPARPRVENEGPLVGGGRSREVPRRMKWTRAIPDWAEASRGLRASALSKAARASSSRFRVMSVLPRYRTPRPSRGAAQGHGRGRRAPAR